MESHPRTVEAAAGGQEATKLERSEAGHCHIRDRSGDSACVFFSRGAKTSLRITFFRSAVRPICQFCSFNATNLAVEFPPRLLSARILEKIDGGSKLPISSKTTFISVYVKLHSFLYM